MSNTTVPDAPLTDVTETANVVISCKNICAFVPFGLTVSVPAVTFAISLYVITAPFAWPCVSAYVILK